MQTIYTKYTTSISISRTDAIIKTCTIIDAHCC